AALLDRAHAGLLVIQIDAVDRAADGAAVAGQSRARVGAVELHGRGGGAGPVLLGPEIQVEFNALPPDRDDRDRPVPPPPEPGGQGDGPTVGEGARRQRQEGVASWPR
ncbi:hypothetical protein LCGC14_2623850, partial [marine sediment metagenome]